MAVKWTEEQEKVITLREQEYSGQRSSRFR